MDFLYTAQAPTLRRISFVPAKRPDTTPVAEGIDLIYLNAPQQQRTEEGNMVKVANNPQNTPRNGLTELFKESDVHFKWSEVRKVGAGLQNLGNTCFMNSVLQCLTHTPPLAEVLLHPHKQGARTNGFDALRITQEHIYKAFHLPNRGSVLAPIMHANTLRRISKSFRQGRQEDAHEYLVSLLDAMHESLLVGLQPKPPRSVQETSMIFRIFAGKIRSQVKCTECGYESNTCDPFLDISLEITRANTLERALKNFTNIEYLEGDNKYKCPKQACLVRAAKRISIDQAPNVLVIQFKRFEFSMFGHKISKKVDFETTLDLGPYMSDRRSPPQLYDLYGVLVHQGHSVHSGHYFCFVRGPNGLWHHMDDSSVSQVSERVVLAQKAYILFYIRKHVEQAAPSKRPTVSSPRVQPSTFNGGTPATAGQQSTAKRKRDADAIGDHEAAQHRQQQGSEAVPEGVSGAGQARGDEGMAGGVRSSKQGPAQEDCTEDSPAEGDRDQKSESDALERRRASNGEATPSTPQEPLSANGSPGSRRLRQVRHVQTRSASRDALRNVLNSGSIGSASAQKVQSAMYGRSWRNWQAHKRLADDFKRWHSMELPSPASLKAASRGSSPLHAGIAPGSEPLPRRTLTRRSRFRPEPAAAAVIGVPNGVEAPIADVPQVAQAAGEALPNGHAVRKSERLGMVNGTSVQPAASGRQSSYTTGTSDGSSSVVSAPDWPPFGPDAASRSKAHAGGPVTSLSGYESGDEKEVSEEQPLSPVSPSKRRKAEETRRVSNPAEVQAVLGANGVGAVGPSGAQRWEDVEISPEAKAQAEAFLSSLAPAWPERDEYDVEYDRGKVKKVKGLGRPDTWNASDGNVFQNAWNTRGRGGRANSLHGGRGGSGRGAKPFSGGKSMRGSGRGRGRRRS